MVWRRSSGPTGSSVRLYDPGWSAVKRVGLLLAVPLFLAAPSPAADPLEEARTQERMLERLTRRWMEGDAAGVLAAVRDSVPGSPGARLRNLEGLALAGLGRHREAVEAYEAGLEQRLDLPELHLNLAISLEALGATGRAMTEFEEAARLDPGSVEARLGLGRGLTRFRRFDRAAQELDLARGFAPEDPRVLRALAGLAAARGDDAGAREAWAALEEVQPSAETARRLAESAPDAAERLRWYGEAATRDHSDPTSAAAAGALALQLGDATAARSWLEPVVRAGAATGADHHNLVLALQASGAAAALEDLAASHPPPWGASWGVVALVRRDAGNPAGALAAARAARERSPDDLELANLEAVCLDDLGRTQDAIAVWEWILARDPGHARARENLEARR